MYPAIFSSVAQTSVRQPLLSTNLAPSSEKYSYHRLDFDYRFRQDDQQILPTKTSSKISLYFSNSRKQKSSQQLALSFRGHNEQRWFLCCYYHKAHFPIFFTTK
jgi:hypothetical protein